MPHRYEDELWSGLESSDPLHGWWLYWRDPHPPGRIVVIAKDESS